MTEITLTAESGARLDVPRFLDWINESNIADEDWNFTTSGILANPKFIFVNEKDALAFKLKFL